jgi:hypothetical protein
MCNREGTGGDKANPAAPRLLLLPGPTGGADQHLLGRIHLCR